MLFTVPNLQGWNYKPLKKELEKGTGAPLFIENDTAIVGLGEATAGAGKGCSIVVYITISTGVGGARIVDGKIDKSAFGFEIGHQIIDAGGGFEKESERGALGARKGYMDLEKHISGKAVEKRFGKKPYEILDPEIWDEEARLLAFGLNNTIVHWSPDIVVLGGSMMKEIGIPIERVRHHLKEIMAIFPELPKIGKAALGDIGGLHGALVFLRQSLGKEKL